MVFGYEFAAAVTALGRKHILEVKDFIEKSGYKILYVDTDSIFVIVDNKENALNLLNKINNILPKPLEMEFEDYYISGIFVENSLERVVLEKNMLLLSENKNIKLRGSEVVRRDWSEIAGEVQENVIRIALEGKIREIMIIMSEVIKNIRNHVYPKEKFIFKGTIKKRFIRIWRLQLHIL
ncbi:DNA polymerase domain-containing protein [Candidatus Nanopusillus massiliensis]|uniref:DNA polymerase domain-containing protein n=1 Tax=Candidatus Nanopusillus massiliensis TaxID=2897163 RepID=UPI001E65C599|nr:DNA polymerase domain-containing protein [Candidatus Nanopusillus massiliensis]